MSLLTSKHKQVDKMKERQWGKIGERKTLQKMKMKRHNIKEA